MIDLKPKSAMPISRRKDQLSTPSKLKSSQLSNKLDSD